MTSLLTKEHLAWIEHEESSVEVEISRNEIIKYAFATEQLQRKYLKGDALGKFIHALNIGDRINECSIEANAEPNIL